MKANESVGIFSAARLGSWQGIPASPHLAFNSMKTFSSYLVTHPKATPNPLVEIKGITLREARRKLCSGPIFSFWEKPNQLLENGIYGAAAVCG